MKFITITKIIICLFIITACQPGVTNYEIAIPGVEYPILSINGTWECSLDSVSWTEVSVPGELRMQGIGIEQDKPYYYKKQISIPSEHSCHNTYVYFEGVYSSAEVWVDNEKVEEHTGGFTPWKCNITPYVAPGETLELVLKCTDSRNDISGASRYAHHPIGGILRNVSLRALPKQHIKALSYTCDFDSDFSDATLSICTETELSQSTAILYQLLDAEGKLITQHSTRTRNNNDTTVMNIATPHKWDSEHPYLYTLIASIIENGENVCTTQYRVGFREVEVIENKLYVNGQSVKLRGANRHDMHPTLGRIATKELDLEDVKLAIESNMNYIRTSHYPPSEYFLDLCDQYGLYVECESAVCFQTKSASDPKLAETYLTQTKEMVQAHRNHPSIIIWSIGNESDYGDNIQNTYDWIKKNDTTRPIKWSWPGKVPEDKTCFDLLSFHYPGVKGLEDPYWGANRTDGRFRKSDFENQDMPIIYDEWAHVATYDYEQLRQDQNVRTYWGKSLDLMWDKCVKSQGALGGAIWGMIDETFMLPDTVVGYGEWGIVDTWRRKKPEFWETKKAYSPVRIQVENIDTTQQGFILIPVTNRFNHTNLNEIQFFYSIDNDEWAAIDCLNVEPYHTGALVLPIENNRNDILIRAYRNDTILVDEELITNSHYTISELPIPMSGVWQQTDTDSTLSFTTKNICCHIDKRSGLISALNIDGDSRINGKMGVSYVVRGLPNSWCSFEMHELCEDLKYETQNICIDNGIVRSQTIATAHNNIKIHIDTRIGANALVEINYKVTPVDARCVQQLGISIPIDSTNYTDLEWRKKTTYWTIYPSESLGARTGNISLAGNNNINREQPKDIWQNDANNLYLNTINHRGYLSQAATASKDNVLVYTIKSNNSPKATKVNGNGQDSWRLSQAKHGYVLHHFPVYDYANLSTGNYMEDIQAKEGECYTASITFE